MRCGVWGGVWGVGGCGICECVMWGGVCGVGCGGVGADVRGCG